MPSTVQLSFEITSASEVAPLVVVYNPAVLPFALLTQIMRYGLVGLGGQRTRLAGKLKGNSKDFTEMIQSYGLDVEIVRAPEESLPILTL